MLTRNKSAARRHDDSPQLHLLNAPAEAKRLPYTIEQVRACQTEVEAIKLAVRCAGLLDKQLADAMGMNEGNLSKLIKGQRGFMPGKRLVFMAAVGNQILRQWEEERLGWDSTTLRVHHSELEKENAELRAKLAQSDHDREVEREYARQMWEARK